MGLLSRVFGGKRDEQDEEASSPADLPAEAAAPAPQSPSHSGSTYRVPTVCSCPVALPSDARLAPVLACRGAVFHGDRCTPERTRAVGPSRLV